MCQPINDELYWCYLPTSLLRRKQWVWDHEATGLAAESRCALAHTARVVTSTSSLASSCAFHPSLSQKWFESVTAPETRQMFNKYQRMRLTVVIAVLSGLSNMLQSTTSLPYHPGVAFCTHTAWWNKKKIMLVLICRGSLWRFCISSFFLWPRSIANKHQTVKGKWKVGDQYRLESGWVLQGRELKTKSKNSV